MSLVERLGFKTLDELWDKLDSNDIFEWIAYDKLKDADWVKEIETEQALQKQKEMSLDEEAEAIRRMFMNLQKK